MTQNTACRLARPVSEDRVRQRFNLDIAVTIEDCVRICGIFDINFNELDLRYPDAAHVALQYDFSARLPQMLEVRQDVGGSS
jgi:hypothetical protein